MWGLVDLKDPATADAAAVVVDAAEPAVALVVPVLVAATAALAVH